MDQPYTENSPATIKDWAKAYVSMGLRVIPIHHVAKESGHCSCALGSECKSPGKHPRVNDWQAWAENNATVDELERSWVWETANIGIVTGQISDVFVIDIDHKHDGMEHFKAWERAFGEVETPWRVLTGGGGYHLYLQYPKGDVLLKNKVGALTGVDFRSDGGFVVAPPSMHVSGKHYQWEM